MMICSRVPLSHLCWSLRTLGKHKADLHHRRLYKYIICIMCTVSALLRCHKCDLFMDVCLKTRDDSLGL